MVANESILLYLGKKKTEREKANLLLLLLGSYDCSRGPRGEGSTFFFWDKKVGRYVL